MSSRTRIAALALVNWKGVFYERYLLDQHVTALEGANGAGKTTVMIAAYIALLPDLTRLRFTNVGETGASGGDRGIWGRLGEPGRPSYTVLDLRVADGSRYIAAVRLTRASEPTLDVTTMGIEGVPDHVPLSSIFLVRHEDSDVVPDLDEIKHNVKAVGGKVTVFRAVKDYFAELFERGISPLRLMSDDDRSKFNDMLRTSMTGGISRSLTSELRGFVLKEESGMSDTLGRMKANLEACRRTRIEVAETRVLEEELAGIYEAGQAMYLAHASALQVHADTAQRNAQQEALRRNDLAQHLREVADNQTNVTRQTVQLSKAAQAARNDQERMLTQWERLKSAAGLRAKLGALDDELAILEHRAAGARAAHEAAQLERVASRQERVQAQSAYERAALGLAELQRGVDELHLRAAEHRRFHFSWSAANELLGREVPMATVSDTLIAIRAQCQEMSAQRAEIERITMDGERRAGNFERATGALAVLEAGLTAMGADTGPAPETLEGRAHVALDQLRLLDLQYAARSELVERLSETLHNTERQQHARQTAAALQLPTVRAAAALATRLESAEQDGATAAKMARHTERRIDERRVQRAALSAELQQLTHALATWRPWLEALRRCWPATTPPSQGELEAAWTTSRQTSDDLLATQADLRAERGFRQQQVLRLGRVGGDADEHLITLRDELGGELLRERCEALPADEGRDMAAALGPLFDAIVVDDPADAATKLAKRKRIDQPVWLVGAELGQGFAHSRVSDVVIANWHGLVRVAPAPTAVAAPAMPATDDASATPQASVAVGLSPRHHEQATLAARIVQIDAQLDELVTALGVAHARTADLDLLLRHSHFLDATDPQQRRIDIDAELAQLATSTIADEAELAALHDRVTQQQHIVDELHEMARDVALLEPPDYGTRTAGLTEQLARCDRFAASIGDLALARTTLLQLIDALRDPPPDADTLRTATLRADGLASAGNKMLQAEHALREAMALRHAAEWSNIDDVLGTQNQLVPTLQEQCSQARRQLQACDDHVLSSDTRWDEASTFRQAAKGTLHGAVELRARLHAELQSLAVRRDASSDPTAELAAIGVQLSELDIALRDALTQAATLAERHTAMQQRQADAASRHDQAITDAANATAAWQTLSQQIAADGLAFPAVTSTDAATLASMAQSKRAVLLDRVARANGASELVDAIRREETNPIDAWHRTRHWLARRVPAQVADHSDPLRALVRLRDQLSMLHARLVRQEGDLRGTSEDVARGIDVQLRRAAGTIKRLNQQLEGIGFGSIGAIRVQMRRIEKMEQILRALRAGEAQELLFLPTMPIEEALDEIFRRYGGAGKSGGQRLLDYREYLELVVEIKRQANPEWEIASPSRLSTGEAIGVGAALMMVVLAEWERDANLLRARPAGGSLRFLFLDEANRLSRDNLGVLFDLCRTLEMQLLIAAPEVARAQGNTTYRLVRHIADDGREEVIVSGRRAMLQAESDADADADADALAVGPALNLLDTAEVATADPTATVADPTL